MLIRIIRQKICKQDKYLKGERDEFLGRRGS